MSEKRWIDCGSKRTGRTQRMLEAAIEAAAQGGSVHIVAASNPHREHLMKRIRSMVESRPFPPGAGIKVVVGGLDDRLRPMSGHGDSWYRDLFIDHYYLEAEWATKMERIMGEMHRWDLPDDDGGGS